MRLVRSMRFRSTCSRCVLDRIVLPVDDHDGRGFAVLIANVKIVLWPVLLCRILVDFLGVDRHRHRVLAGAVHDGRRQAADAQPARFILPARRRAVPP